MGKIKIDLDFSDMTLSEILTVIESAAESYVNRLDAMPPNQSIIDKEEQKILHEIETAIVGTVEGYKLFDRLRKNRRMRRVVKNDLKFNEIVTRQGFHVRNLNNQLKKIRGKKVCSNEKLEEQREYLNFERLGTITQSDVENYTDSLVESEKNTLINLASALSKNNAETKYA